MGHVQSRCNRAIPIWYVVNSRLHNFLTSLQNSQYKFTCEIIFFSVSTSLLYIRAISIWKIHKIRLGTFFSGDHFVGPYDVFDAPTTACIESLNGGETGSDCKTSRVY